jgi:hypothetical protein
MYIIKRSVDSVRIPAPGIDEMERRSMDGYQSLYVDKLKDLQPIQVL